MSVPIRFVAVISSNNSPLYLKSYDDTAPDASDSDLKDKDLRYHFLAHMALDYVDTQLRASESARDHALLLVHDGIAVYGSLSNTGVKILIGTNAHDSLRFDIRPTFRAIQATYISYVCNPFFDSVNQDQAISSRLFERSINTTVQAWNQNA